MPTGRGLVALCSVVTLITLIGSTEAQAAKPPRTAAFVYVASSANSCDTGLTELDHPLTNGNPNAVILVTVNQGVVTDPPGITASGPIAVLYDQAGSLCGTAGQWILVNPGVIPVGQRLNIFITAP
jgi:hypothetical protein